MTISAESRMLASVILRAVAVRKGSYNTEIANKAGKDADPATFYDLTLASSCDVAARYLKVTALAYPALLLLSTNCVDIISWANAITDPTATCEPSIYSCQHDADYGCPLCLANYARVGSK